LQLQLQLQLLLLLMLLLPSASRKASLCAAMREVMATR